MILTAIIIIILMGCWIHGRRMGLIGLVITTVAYFFAWLMARLGARFVGAALAGILPSITDSTNSTVTSLLKTSTSEFFYSGVSFMLIFWAITFFSRWLLHRFNWVRQVPVVGTVNGWAGGALDCLLGYLIIFVFLFIFQLLPVDWWQSQLAASGLAQWIINQTPGMAKVVISWVI